MKKFDYAEVRQRVDRLIGSMALDGILVSRTTKANMLRIALGRASADQVKKTLIETYRQS